LRISIAGPFYKAGAAKSDPSRSPLLRNTHIIVVSSAYLEVRISDI